MGKKKDKKVSGTVAAAAATVQEVTLEDIEEAARKGHSNAFKKVLNYIEQKIESGEDPQEAKGAAIDAVKDGGNPKAIKVLEGKVDADYGPNYNAWLKKQEEHDKAMERRRKELLPGFDGDKASAAAIKEDIGEASAALVEQVHAYFSGAVKNIRHEGLAQDLVDKIAGNNSMFVVLCMRIVLNSSAEIGRLETAKAMLQEITGTHKDSNGNKFSLPKGDLETAFLIASEHGHFEVVKAIVEYMDSKGFLDVNTKGDGNEDDLSKNTALHHAVSNENLEFSKYLLDRGASYKIANSEGETALDLALQSRSSEIAQEFVNRASVDESTGILTSGKRLNLNVANFLAEKMQNSAAVPAPQIDEEVPQASEAPPRRSPSPSSGGSAVGGDGSIQAKR